MNPQLISLAIELAPGVISNFKSLFAKNNPNAPTPTDAEVFAAFNSAFFSSLAKDDAYLAIHPPK